MGVHVRLHSPHADHCDTPQSRGHWCPLHGRRSIVFGQGAPPLALLRRTSRVRVLAPAPHDLEQIDQSDHDRTLQATGHGASAQRRDWLWMPQLKPPCIAFVLMARLRLCVPPMHVFVHVLHEPHSSITQSRGHLGTSHARCCLRPGQAPPPKAARSTIRPVKQAPRP